MKFVCAFLLYAAAITRIFACEVVDDQGHVLKFSHPAQRIISLAPDLTELLFAAGAGSKIIGVVQGSDYPVAAKKIPVVADYNHVDAEKILRLQPDLIVVWADSSLPLQVKNLGVPVYVSQQKKLLDIPYTLQRLGCLAGTTHTAQTAAQHFMQHYNKLKNNSHRTPQTVFFQLWPAPLMTVNKTSWINEIIELCGGKNIFADLYGTTPEVNIEAVLNKNPQIIFALADEKNWQTAWRAWPELTAVKKNHLYSIDADLVERAGPRILNGAEEVCSHLIDKSIKMPS